MQAQAPGVVEMLARLSHDIRVHMTSIVGHAENCSSGNLKGDAAQDAMEIVVRNSRRLRSLFDVVLNLSEIEVKDGGVSATKFNPVQLLQSVQTDLEDSFEGQSPRVDLVYPGPVPQTVKTDAIGLRSILQLILKNYLEEVTPQSARVEVSVISTGGDQGALCFEVKPCAEGTSKPVGNVSDLGYSVAKELAAVIGGELSVLRRVGAGSEVRFLLPIGSFNPSDLVDAETALAPRKVVSKDRALLSDARILVAEDDPDNQKLIRYILERAGAEVLVVPDGAEAVNTVDDYESAGNPFHLVLMDIEMPVMDGYEATRQIRLNGHEMPIVALSAQPRSMADEEVKASGLSEFASKSMGRAGLVQRLHDMLDPTLVK